MALVVEDLTPVRHRDGFEEMAGTSDGKSISVGVTNAGVLPDAARSNAFAQEVARTLTLEHHNIARTLAVDAAGELRWAVAWQRFEGPTLDRVLAEKGTLLPDEAVSVTMALAQALVEAHSKGVVHGNVSPEWVTLLSLPSSVEVRLGGFGLGMLSSIAGARKVSPFVDVAGLGAILHHLLTGHPPAGKVGALPPSALHLGAVLSKALGLDLSSRFRTMAEFAHALTEANRTRVSGGHVVVPAGGPSPVGALRTLGQWELTQLIGEGAMGQVFLGKHALLGRQAAIKVLRPEQYQRDDLIQRFFQEARSVNQINHEHIVEISDFGQELGPDGKPTAVYFVMELLQGETLTARLANGPMAINRVLHIIKQLASALSAAHRLGVVHRDVKTDNVFLITRQGDPEYVKVLDFGVAKLTQVADDAPTVSTMDGAIIGTPTSMSPEQASGGAVDRRADVYAVGVMLYLLLSGRLPIDGDNFGKLVAALLTKVPDPLPPQTAGGEPIPAWLSELVRRCLEKDPAKRPQTMEEVTTALSNPSFVSARSVAQTEMVYPPDAEPRVPGTRRRLFAVVSGVLAVCAAGAAIFWPRDLPPIPQVVDAGVVVEVAPVVDAAVEFDAGVVVEPEVADAGEEVDVPDASVPDAGAAVTPVGPKKPVKLSKPLVLAGIGRASARFNFCTTKFKEGIPVSRKLDVRWTIQKSGQTTDAAVLEQGVSADLKSCLEKAMGTMTFPLNVDGPRSMVYTIPVIQK